jgi:hypothetical protein
MAGKGSGRRPMGKGLYPIEIKMVKLREAIWDARNDKPLQEQLKKELAELQAVKDKQ